MKKIVIIGVGGFGREVAWLIERINKVQPTWELLGFLDDKENIHGTIVNGYPVLGSSNWIQKHNDVFAVCAIASTKVRKNLIERLEGVKFATIIDPSVILSDKVIIGEGSIICANTILTVNIKIGSHVIINLDCTIGHDVVVKNFATLYPSVNISGNTILEECVEMGTGSKIIQGLKVGKGTIVGAGAVVVKNINDTGTYIGIPARRIK